VKNTVCPSCKGARRVRFLSVRKRTVSAAAHPKDRVLFGRADFSTVPPTTPTHALLDRAVADRPVVIHNTSEHALWLNSAALAMAALNDRPVADADQERGARARQPSRARRNNGAPRG
jgi:predicted amidohydrolase YtcJ